jgi:hypothetical protein
MDLIVDLAVAIKKRPGVQSLKRSPPSPGAERARKKRLSHEVLHSPDEALDVAEVHQKTSLPVDNELLRKAVRGRDCWHSFGHSLEDHTPAGLVPGVRHKSCGPKENSTYTRLVEIAPPVETSSRLQVVEALGLTAALAELSYLAGVSSNQPERWTLLAIPTLQDEPRLDDTVHALVHMQTADIREASSPPPRFQLQHQPVALGSGLEPW